MAQTLRWGILGTAAINDWIIPSIRLCQRSKLVAIASRRMESARAHAQQWRIPTAYGSYDDLLADDQIDAVYIPLPNHLHVEWSIRAVESGKHVLCEKPIALDTDGVDQLIDASQRSGRIIQEANMTHAHTQTAYVRQLLQDDAVGDVHLIDCIFAFSDETTGFRADPSIGGGSLWDIGTYCVSFARTVLNEEPTEASATQCPLETGADDRLYGRLNFPSGAVLQFMSSMGSFDFHYAVIHGATGVVSMDHPWLNPPGLTSHITLARKSPDALDHAVGAYTDELDSQTRTYMNCHAHRDQFLAIERMVFDGGEPFLPLASSRANIPPVLALLESAKTGQVVAL